MLTILIRWFCVTATIVLAARLVPGLRVLGWQPAMIAALFLGALNLAAHPIFTRLQISASPLASGALVLAMNAVFFYAVAAIVADIFLEGFAPAVAAAAFVTTAANALGAFGGRGVTQR